VADQRAVLPDVLPVFPVPGVPNLTQPAVRATSINRAVLGVGGLAVGEQLVRLVVGLVEANLSRLPLRVRVVLHDPSLVVGQLPQSEAYGVRIVLRHGLPTRGVPVLPA